MQTFVAASFDMMRPTGAPSPPASSSLTGTKQAFDSHLQHAADKRAAARHFDDPRNTTASEQDSNTLSDSMGVPESPPPTGQQPAAEENQSNHEQPNSSDNLEISLTQPASGPSAQQWLINGTQQEPGRTGSAGATVLQMLATITGTTPPNADGAIAATPPRVAQPATDGIQAQAAAAPSSDPVQLATTNDPTRLVTVSTHAQLATGNASPASPSANTMAANTASPAADDWLSVARNIQISVQSSGDIQATPASPPAATTIVFNPADESVTTIAEDAATLLPETDGEPGAPLVVQNKYGQIITIQYNSTPVVTPSNLATVSSHSQVAANNSTMDIADQYIHSHLPDHTGANADDASDNAMPPSQQAESTTANNTAQDFDGQATFEQLTVTKTLNTNGGESQPFLFSHQQVGSQSATTASTSESSLYRLPSGVFVPEGTVIDQMIAHFSVNKRLESGSVNLKLYPQELGELRMELKVEQDNVKAHIIAQSPQAQEMIDRHMPKLREALEQQGLHLQQIEVTVAAQDNGNGERFQDSSAWQQTGRFVTPPNAQTLFEHQLEEELGSEERTDNNLNVIA